MMSNTSPLRVRRINPGNRKGMQDVHAFMVSRIGAKMIAEPNVAPILVVVNQQESVETQVAANRQVSVEIQAEAAVNHVVE